MGSAVAEAAASEGRKAAGSDQVAATPKLRISAALVEGGMVSMGGGVSMPIARGRRGVDDDEGIQVQAALALVQRVQAPPDTVRVHRNFWS